MFATVPRCLTSGRYAPFLAIMIAGLAMGGCKDQPTTAPLNPPSNARFAAGADQGWIRSSFFVDFRTFVPCLGEEVRVFGEVPFTYHSVATPSGGFDFTRRFPPVTPNTPQFYIQGLTSGTLYTYSNGHPINESFHLAAGEVYSHHQRERYTAADGSKLFATFTSHSTTNANGVLTVSKAVVEDINCG